MANDLPVLGNRLVPSLLVSDLEATLAFYNHLGFARTGVFPDEDAPIWAEVTRGGIVLQFYTEPLRRVGGDWLWRRRAGVVGDRSGAGDDPQGTPRDRKR